MTYPETYKQHITTEYDKQFVTVEELKWDPFVGKNYHKTGVFIVGMSTYALLDTEWGQKWKEYTAQPQNRDPSRILVCDESFAEGGEHKSFRPMSKMFLEGASKQHNKDTITMFWESVAFNNFCQEAVDSVHGFCEGEAVERANRALLATIGIIKPRVCLVWTTELWKMGLSASREHEENIGHRKPRIIDQTNQTPPIVGIGHPIQGFNAVGTLDFLRTDSASKQPVEDFLQYLKEQPN